MGILNLTHDAHGQVIERLPVVIKVAIGEGPDPNDPRSYPKRLDHFVIKRKVQKGKEVVWEEAPDLMKLYGEKPTEIGIILLDNHPENVLKTALAWWSKTECKCRGELVQIANGGSPKFEMRATRRTERHPEGEPWPPKGSNTPGCGDGCPDFERGDCKNSADLYFMLDKFPMLGGVCRIHTTSYRSIRNLANALEQFRQLRGGQLTGLRVMLKAAPEKVSFDDPKQQGKKSSSIAHILSLEISATDMQKLLDNMAETAKLFAQMRQLGAPRIVVEENDDERAPEIAGEFHPAPQDEARSEGQRALPAAAVIPTPEQIAQQARVRELCAQLNYNEARTHMLLGQNQQDLPGLIARLETAVAANRALEGSEPGAETPSSPPAATHDGPTAAPDAGTRRGKATSTVAAPPAPQTAPAKQGKGFTF